MPTENHTTLTPDTPVRYLKGVGPKTCCATTPADISTSRSPTPSQRPPPMWNAW